MDQTISRNKIREKNKLNTFDNIRNVVENITKHLFNMKILQQILYVVPHFYILKYYEKKNSKTFNINDALSKEYDLLIDIPKDFEERISKNYPDNFDFLSINFYDLKNEDFCSIERMLNFQENNKRKDIFKNILIKIVNIYHDNYLKRNKINLGFNPLIEKSWYHKFNPDEECKDIPLFEIPLPPNKTSIFQDIIMKNDIKKEILEISFNYTNKIVNGNGDNKNLDLNNKNISSSKNKYVSQKFLEKIREKESVNKIVNQVNNYNKFHNSIKDMNSIYKEILLQIKIKLLLNGKSMELRNISESIFNSSPVIKENICSEKIKKL